MTIDPEIMAIHNRAVVIASNFENGGASVVDILIEVHNKKVNSTLGYPRLFRYAHEALHLSKNNAYYAVSVVEKCLKIPNLHREVSTGNISLSTAKKMVSVITPENHEVWIERAKTLTTRKLERLIAEASPRAAVQERAKYVNGNRFELTLGIDDSAMVDFRKVQNLVCRTKGQSVNLEDTLVEMIRFYLKQKDPDERAKRVIGKKGFGSTRAKSKKEDTQPDFQFTFRTQGKAEPEPNSNVKNTESLFARTNRTRKPLPAHVEHEVRLRDQGQCQFRRFDGSICGEARFIHLHHIIPVYAGGPDTVENLITLCSQHHSVAHHQMDRRQEEVQQPKR